jgi:hypothetical protein
MRLPPGGGQETWRAQRSATAMSGDAPPGIRRRPRAAVVAMVTAAVGLAGCGQGGSRAEIRGTTDGFFAALQRGDGAAACARLSADTVAQLISEEQEPCAQAVTSLKLRPGAIRRIQVYMTNAKVDLAGGASAFLDRTANGWRLSAIGCRPAEGKPADLPFDCELEA